MAGPIVTLTLNPSLDMAWSVDVVVPAHKMRAQPDRVEPGGGGINVSRVCDRLGHPTVAVATLGGPIGDQVDALLTAGPIDFHRVDIAGATRQSVTVLERTSGAQYRFVLPGPSITAAEQDQALAVLSAEAGDDGWIVISGSVPPGIDDGFLRALASELGGHRMIIDTSGTALTAAFEAGVHVVKPSVRELGRALDRELDTEADVVAAAAEVLDRFDVEVIVASIGAGGAVVVCADGRRLRVRAPTVRVRSAVGAGDSMVAGLTVALDRGLDIEAAAAYAVAAGSAAVMTDGTELCHPEDLERLLPMVGVEPLRF